MRHISAAFISSLFIPTLRVDGMRDILAFQSLNRRIFYDGIVKRQAKSRGNMNPSEIFGRKTGQTTLHAFGLKRNGSQGTTNGTNKASSNPYTFKIYCDLDGVLCDFEAGVKNIFNGQGPDDVGKSAMWRGIGRCDAFYENLAWTRDGKELWNAIKDLDPDILTGVPMSKCSRIEKARWCSRELFGVTGTNHVDMAGPSRTHDLVSGARQENVVNVITCWSNNKHFESGVNAVLIDDRKDLGDPWRKKGGIFILHTDTASTLEKLRDCGIISSDEEAVRVCERRAL